MAEADSLEAAMSSASAPPPGHLRLLYFASAADFTKRSSEDFAAPTTPQQLYRELGKRYPGIKAKVLKSCGLAVNMDYVDLEEEASGAVPETVIREGDVVALIPPVSAG